MRRSRREQYAPSGLSSADLMRMVAGIMVLLILIFSIWRARDPRNWQWLASADLTSGSSSEDAASGHSSRAATRPTAKHHAAAAKAQTSQKSTEKALLAQNSGKAPAKLAAAVAGTASTTGTTSAAGTISLGKTAATATAATTAATASGQNAAGTANAAAAASDNMDGLTDEDPEQFDAAQEEFQALTDGNLKLAREESEAYDRLIFWVKNQSFEQLWKRGRKNPSYSTVYDGVDDHRGQIFSLDVTIRLVRDVGKSRYGVPLHEAWAVTAKSRDRLYDLIILNFPNDIPEEKYIREKARFAGYLLKLQGYYAASAKPGRPPEIAPLLIGRIEWRPASETAEAAEPNDSWPQGVMLVAIGVVVVALVGLFFVLRRQLGAYSTTPKSLLLPTTGHAIPIDQWLERPEGLFAEDESSEDVAAPEGAVDLREGASAKPNPLPEPPRLPSEDAAKGAKNPQENRG